MPPQPRENRRFANIAWGAVQQGETDPLRPVERLVPTPSPQAFEPCAHILSFGRYLPCATARADAVLELNQCLLFGPFPEKLDAAHRKYRSRSGAGRLIRFLCALGLAGVAIRLSLLAIPPVIPLVHADLGMSEAQVGLLIGLPLAVFAVTSVLGSLLIARIGSTLAVILGITIAALGGGGRGAAGNVWTLYAAVAVMGFGIAITQPALPALVREWMPKRIALGTVVYSSGMVIGATLGSALTIPYILPLVGGSWRLDLGIWSLVALLIVPAILFARSAWLGPACGIRHWRPLVAGFRRSGGLASGSYLRRQ